jgi:membrane associated rhomboid family serine protease
MEIDRATPVCYRHPDRETMLRCSNCNKPICVECSRDTAVGQKCPECSKPEDRHRVVDARQAWTPKGRFASAPVSYSIMAISIGLFVLGLVSSDIDRELTINLAQFNFAVAAGEWYRIFSAALLHASITHILFNMYALWLFGPRLEQQVGSVPFAIAYAAFAAAGGAFFFIFGEDLAAAVGASGAIFGLFGVWTAATWRMRHTAAGQAMFRQLIFLLAINAALPLFIPSIAWEAHLGGFLAGLAVGWAWGQFAAGKPDATRIRTGIATAALVIPVVIVLVA